MSPRPALSKAETEVVRLVWEARSATVREIYDQFCQDNQVDLSTVQTYLRRLEQKGYLKSTRDGRNLVYSPRVQRRTVVRETVNDLVQRLFGGDKLPLMLHLIEDGEASREQIEKLRDALDRLENENE